MANRELIDRNELLNTYRKWIPQLALPEDEGDKRGVETCIAVLEDAQVVDAVEVVRCQYCRYGHYMKGSRTYLCNNPFYSEYEFHKENHYCSYGEKRI